MNKEKANDAIEQIHGILCNVTGNELGEIMQMLAYLQALFMCERVEEKFHDLGLETQKTTVKDYIKILKEAVG